jgi:hypothetical protein
MVVWAKTGSACSLPVDLNLDPLRKILRTLSRMSNQSDSSRDALSLNGNISGQTVGDRAVALASTFAKTVVNNMKSRLRRGRQILLRVSSRNWTAEASSVRPQLGRCSGGNPIGASTGQFGVPPSGNVTVGPGGRRRPPRLRSPRR